MIQFGLLDAIFSSTCTTWVNLAWGQWIMMADLTSLLPVMWYHTIVRLPTSPAFLMCTKTNKGVYESLQINQLLTSCDHPSSIPVISEDDAREALYWLKSPHTVAMARGLHIGWSLPISPLPVPSTWAVGCEVYCCVTQWKVWLVEGPVTWYLKSIIQSMFISNHSNNG